MFLKKKALPQQTTPTEKDLENEETTAMDIENEEESAKMKPKEEELELKPAYSIWPDKWIEKYCFKGAIKRSFVKRIEGILSNLFNTPNTQSVDFLEPLDPIHKKFVQSMCKRYHIICEKVVLFVEGPNLRNNAENAQNFNESSKKTIEKLKLLEKETKLRFTKDISTTPKPVIPNPLLSTHLKRNKEYNEFKFFSKQKIEENLQFHLKEIQNLLSTKISMTKTTALNNGDLGGLHTLTTHIIPKEKFVFQDKSRILSKKPNNSEFESKNENNCEYEVFQPFLDYDFVKPEPKITKLAKKLFPSSFDSKNIEKKNLNSRGFPTVLKDTYPEYLFATSKRKEVAMLKKRFELSEELQFVKSSK